MPKYLQLSGRTLAEWSEELHMDSKKVLEFPGVLKKEGKIKDVEFV